MEIAHGRVLPQVRSVDVGRGGLEVYKVSFPRTLNLADCPVEGCPTKETPPGSLGKKIMFCHWKSKVAILQEGQETLPRRDQCGIYMQEDRLFKHRHSDRCHKSMERRLRQRDEEKAARCGDMEFNLDGEEGDERVGNLPTF